MAAEIVHHDDVDRLRGWHQKLYEPRQKAGRVDRAAEGARGDDPVATQTGHEGPCLTAAVRHFGDRTLASGTTSMKPGHIGVRPCLIDKDQPPGSNPAQEPLPLLAPPGHITPVLLAGVQNFLKAETGMPSRHPQRE